jgi:hypothetical protein
MMRQSLSQALPEPGPGVMNRAGIGEMAFRQHAPRASIQQDAPRVSVRQHAPRVSVRQHAPRVSVRQHAPRASIRQRVAGWRARNWRRAILAWFVLSLAIMAVAAEPKTDFPKAQVSSVPAARVALRVAGVLTTAGVPVLLIALP